ncbi:uncharacterized protein Z519_11779 [Cladophialophora bantiana CBS 173.52]|uniref:Uncharacterized protein n=1 Tax=Cladophialophora bantiana (strain ATCC 10958 / CBS 173.52 / CDC B-1940 / NIH 8579) TaxID=1442370 RepID=A0A0D2FL88_CLAB1|nr:uncharacterized protein Z519_11779 [Cladophialophora bantiana CBS 173.52]KIW87457.1 hypothetical protein Z519_11779 [Cladophialophora bantiana CBS 173.52]
MGPKERKLLKAAGQGDLAETDRLVQDGANLSTINEDGESALSRAVNKKHNTIAKLFLENGATTDYTGPLVKSPLHIAVQTGNVGMVELLLNSGADIDEVKDVDLVLSQAIKANRDDVICLLLSRDTDVNLSCNAFSSPLGHALRHKNERLVQILFKYGADRDVVLDRVLEAVVRAAPESLEGLVRDWRAQGYEEFVKTIRSPPSDMAEKEKVLAAALICASKRCQPENHSIFVELAEEFNIARNKAV